MVGVDPSLKAWLEFQVFRRFAPAGGRLQFIVGLSDALATRVFAQAFDVRCRPCFNLPTPGSDDKILPLFEHGCAVSAGRSWNNISVQNISATTITAAH